MEEYKKKYEEIIKSLKEAKESMGGYTFSSVVDKIIPELKESEDENVRKWIVDELKDSLHTIEALYSGDYDNRDKDDIIREGYLRKALDWLEKQGIIGNINEKLRAYREYLVKETERWHKKEENKTLRRIDKQDCIGHANAYISARSKFEDLFNYDSWLKRQGEQKLAWSEEDEGMCIFTIKILNDIHYKDNANWLKSLKERMKGE